MTARRVKARINLMMKRHRPLSLAVAGLVVIAASTGIALATRPGQPAVAGDPSNLGAPAALTNSAFVPVVRNALWVTTTSSTNARMLAANCFQCHGTDGHAVDGMDGLAGKSAPDIVNDMRDMSAGTIGNNIMRAHARSYTEAEIQLIADYFSKQ